MSKSRLISLLVAAYLAANVLLFFTNSYKSRWHYQSHDPIPIQVTAPTDSSMSLTQIRDILDSIDLAYDARKPTSSERLWKSAEQLIQIAFLPSTVALLIKNFLGYMGPANPAQRAFTVSVKQRYNHLAELAVKKGMADDGFLFLEEASLTKKNGQPFRSLRTEESSSAER